jgi:serine protease AprX
MKHWQKIFHLFLVLVMLSGLVGTVAVSKKDAADSVQPALAQLAAESPEQEVRVIVQQADEEGGGQRLIEALGGTYLRELSFIDGFVATLPAKEVTRLAQSDGVNWVSLDAPVISTGKPDKGESDDLPNNVYLDTLGVRDVWAMGYTGAGIGVAVIDSGISNDSDLNINRQVSFNPNSRSISDVYGHGTHVAGIIGGNGTDSNGLYKGVAPDVDLFGLKISDESGLAYESDTVDAMQWVFDNKDDYNIRVVNLSIQSTVEQSYHDSALSAAAQILWFNGVVVTAATGNWYGGNIYPLNAAPANDPFVITVGAVDEKGTTRIKDDRATTFSVWGLTQDGFFKPEIFAPGQDIYGVLSKDSSWAGQYPDRVVNIDGKPEYFRISGTSMATPMVSGAVALLLQAEPDLTPDQVKYRVMNAKNWAGSSPYLSIYKMLTTPTTESTNQGIVPHMLLAKMALIAYWSSQNGEENIDWESVDWDAVNWDAVDWDAVNWNAVNWNAVNWNAVNWNAVNWNAVNWNAVNWNAVNWNAVNWNAVNWNAVNWNAVNWNAVSWED